ncbi:sensor histidine kinase [Modestobacter italicus]|uniref:sensor histidine kinase n=1 Tax=Modestobacter italicus (strain DSM 44449 / CECT 9708 / BC 501) TaxID=2732864 RepID=UPI001C9837C2|nr:sensor histidine kinase [Modestobacter italicus]
MVESTDELLAVAVPYLEDGLRAGDLTVLSCDPETTGLLRAELRAGDALVSDPRVSLRGARPPDAFGVTRSLVEQAQRSRTGRMRLFGQPLVGSAPRDWRETARYEAVANIAVGDLPMDALCCYDASAVPAEVLESVRRTHPQVLRGGVVTPNLEFRRPDRFLRELPLPRESMEAGPPVYAVDGAPTLADLRHQLAAVLAGQVPDREQRQDMHLAVSEIAANAFRHGRPPVSARVWASADWVVCTITDSGRGLVDPLAGFRPAHGDDLSRGGMGLWLARKLWDHVDLLTGPQGFTVRLSTPLR